MRKLIAAVLTFVILTIGCGGAALAADTKVTVKMDGKEISFPDAQPYINKDDRTMVPIRFIAEALGAKVDWDNSTQTAIIEKGKKITLKIGEKRAFVDGQQKTFDTKAELKQERTFVPLRYVSETLGVTVDWDAATFTVIISTTGSRNQSLNQVIEVVSGSALTNSGLLEYGNKFYITTGSSGEKYNYYIVINSYDSDTLNAVKKALQVFYPTDYEKAYQNLIKTINGSIKKDGLRYLGIKDLYFDGRYYGSTKFDDGTSIYVGYEGRKY